VSLRAVPRNVRVHIYLFWTGIVLAGVGVLGFLLSFWQVGSSAAATVDVHSEIPVLAYASIAAWVIGLGTMWHSRRKLDAAVAEKTRQDREQMFVTFDGPPGPDDDGTTAASAGREP
jgi:hypothetical protein